MKNKYRYSVSPRRRIDDRIHHENDNQKNHNNKKSVFSINNNNNNINKNKIHNLSQDFASISCCEEWNNNSINYCTENNQACNK